MEFFNSYEDEIRAREYSKLEFHNTYYLAFRDLPEIFNKYVNGKKAIDFGCGTGRSTRFLKKHGFSVEGIDISEDMIKIARKIDPKGNYHLVEDGNYSKLNPNSYDLILSAFTFDNIPMDKKEMLFSNLKNLLNEEGIFINLVCSPEIYTLEWASFSTKDFPDNKYKKSGDVVRIITTDFDDKRPCYDVLCSEKDYKKIYLNSGFELIKTYKPLAEGNEPLKWVNETKIAPWTIYVLKRKNNGEA
jgi:ubiquinone/menaquinone biosynthesis C-methylase UbiE